MQKLMPLLTALCVSCASSPSLPPQVVSKPVDVPMPYPVPCVTEAERPKFPDLTDINLDTATPMQKAAALARDAEAIDRYAQAVDALFQKCVKGASP